MFIIKSIALIFLANYLNRVKSSRNPNMTSYEIKPVASDDEIGLIVNRDFTDDFVRSFVLIGDDETCLPEYYLNYAEIIKHFDVRNSDIMVATHPKAGTTWAQEMVWLITNSLDYEGAEVSLHERFPFLELCALYDFPRAENLSGHKGPKWTSQSIDFVNELESPRFIKTHLPVSLLPEQIQNGSKSPKIIYVMRNPKDVCVSFYHHGNLLEGWRANFEDFCKVFLAGKVLYGSYWKHVLGYWALRDSPNLLIIKYEDMKRDLSSIIKKVATFLGKTLTEAQIEVLSDHLSFESMKNNTAVNFQDIIDNSKQVNPSLHGAFMRSGTVGKFKEEMSEEMIRKFNEWIDGSVAGSSFEQEVDYKLEI